MRIHSGGSRTTHSSTPICISSQITGYFALGTTTRGESSTWTDRSGPGDRTSRQRCLPIGVSRSEEHTSELQSLTNLVCRLLLEKKKETKRDATRQRNLG